MVTAGVVRKEVVATEEGAPQAILKEDKREAMADDMIEKERLGGCCVA